MTEKDEMTILNIGWDYACAKMPEKLSVYASRGFILSAMDSRTFTLTRGEPEDIDYIIVPSGSSGHEEYGWRLLCESSGYSAYSAPRGTDIPGKEKADAENIRRMTRNTVILLDFAAVILFLLLRADTDNKVLSVLRSAALLIAGAVFGFSAFRLISVIKKSGKPPRE